MPKRGRYPEATPEQVEKARRMRKARATYKRIGESVGLGTSWAHKVAGDVVPDPKPVKPGTPELRMRAHLLLMRGFDVPPSRLDEYRALRRKGFPAPEAAKVLGLE